MAPVTFAPAGAMTPSAEFLSNNNINIFEGLSLYLFMVSKKRKKKEKKVERGRKGERGRMSSFFLFFFCFGFFNRNNFISLCTSALV